ncbi:MAG: hypothetical protein MEQ07_07355 [Aquimonas sp.]|nr:hypothetical protein [Aquimonas sp.]
MRLDREKVMRSNGFLNFHPDILNRHRGFEALSQQRAEEALGHLKRAARFADKASQAVIAELYFKGEGVPQDRALGYAWMDLAAERGWQGFLALREHYWAQLDDSERKRAIEVGQGVYAEYEDAVAKPRLEAQLRRGRREMTGSRIGSPGALKIIYGDDVIGVRVRLDERGLGSSSVPGHLYYADEFWLPEAYWEWQAQVWDRPLRGLVDVLPLQRAEP